MRSAFNRDLFARYGPESGGFEISPEITFQVLVRQRRVAEVDVRHLKRARAKHFLVPSRWTRLWKNANQGLGEPCDGTWFTFDW